MGPDPAELKLALAGHGVRVDPSAGPTTGSDARSTIDLVLPGDLRMGTPVSDASPLALVAENGRLAIALEAPEGGERVRVEVRVVPPPQFLERRTRRGLRMGDVAAVRGSHLILSPGGACGFSVRGTPCRFCVEGARVTTGRVLPPVEDVLEVVRAAFGEGVAEDVYFNSGIFDADDGGIGFLASYVEAVRKHFDTLIAVQTHPPRTNAWIDRTYAMGVDALSYNLEIFDAGLLHRHCIGRARYVGRERYLEALTHAAEIFPSGTVWCDLAIGLEPMASTRAGIDALAAVGVLPVLSIVAGERGALAGEDVTPLLAHLYRAVKTRGINMGWVRDLGLAITPLEARHLAGDGARLAVTVQSLSRSRLGGLAARALARFRRRLRVRKVQESFDSTHV
jgi:hypothetical protein